jgi:hypothetical protein
LKWWENENWNEAAAAAAAVDVDDDDEVLPPDLSDPVKRYQNDN